MSPGHRDVIASAYRKFLYQRQRIPLGLGCEFYQISEASCAFCSRWYDGRSTYAETEDDGACAYARVANAAAKCYPMRLIKAGTSAKTQCNGDKKKRDRASESMGQKLALQQALKLTLISSSFHATNLAQTTGAKRRRPVSRASRGRPFKALVVLFLEGGSDSFNLLVSHSMFASSTFTSDAVPRK